MVSQGLERRLRLRALLDGAGKPSRIEL